MVDRHRVDSPGTWHHVMNRGVARRTVVEGERDAGEFLAAVERVVEEGLLEVHVYCLMGTHFHMLVRSPGGELSRAMMLLQNTYARWFNRGRRRDGPLWRGRFLSKAVHTAAYWSTLVRYIDHNPVEAGIVGIPEAYTFGSSRHYGRSREGPRWLSRDEIEAAVKKRSGKPVYDPSDYGAVFGKPLSRSAHRMLERFGFAKTDVEEALKDLVAAAPEKVRGWMRRKAKLADGVADVGVGLIEPGVLLTALESLEAAAPDWWIRPGRRRKSGWRALRCTLLHQFSGCTIDEIARRVGTGASTVGRHLSEHRKTLLENAEYERRSAEIVSGLLSVEYGSGW